MPSIPAFMRWRQEGEASLVDGVRSSTAGATQRNLSQKVIDNVKKE